MSITYEELLERDGGFLYRTKGTSMLPMLRENKDVIYIEKRPAGRLKQYDVILYRVDSRYLLHRITQVNEKDYTVCGDNLIYLESVTDDQIIGVLKYFIRDGKEIPVTDSKYLKYAKKRCAGYTKRRKKVLFKKRLKGILKKAGFYKASK